MGFFSTIADIGSGIADYAKTNQDWLGPAINAAGTAYGAYAANKAGEQYGADSLAAAKIATDAAAFKPYSVTTGLGTSYFDPNAQTAGYTLDPALAAYRDKMMMMSAEALPTSMDTGAAAQQYYDEMQAMMAPSRQAENLAMQQDLFGSGRLGMRMAGAGAGAGSGMVQPDVFGLNQARSQADAALAQQARTQSQAELDAAIARGTGLFQTGVGIEQLGLTPLELGGTFGGYGSTAGAAQASSLLSGGLNAALANQQSGLRSAGMWSGLANELGSLRKN
jgi:hypothetical protein